MRSQNLFVVVWVALALVLAACGEDATSSTDANPVAEETADTTADDDLPEDEPGEDDLDEPADDVDEVELPDFGEDTEVALFDCVDGDDFACELAYDYLGGDDGLRPLASACDQGDDFSCQAFDRIVAVVGEGLPPEDEPVADDSTGEGDVRGFVVLNGAGVETSEGTWFFGEAPDGLVDAVTAELGPASDDTGFVPSGDGSGCGGTEYRFVSWDDSLTLTFLDESEFASGVPHVAAWQHNGGAAVFAEGFIGDETTVAIEPGFTTVTQLTEAFGPESTLVYDEPPIGPTYEVSDNLGTILGELSDTSDDGVVQTAYSGSGCGE